MTRAEAELHSIRTTIEAYQMILKNNNNLSQEDYKKAIDETISRLNKLFDIQKRSELKKMLKDDTLSAEEKLRLSTQIFQELKNQ